MSKHSVVDAAQRQRALDPAHSFIVQAPAGSGKTGLITQRFLTLLATVNAPEEVVAITFTRKAAAEMRARILEALLSASQPEPDDPHQRTSWQRAKAALARDAEQGWQLLDNPSRLAVQTIDSLCAWLTRQLPLLANFGAQPQVSEDGEALYREAARLSLLDLEQGHDWSAHIETLLQHLDNDLAKTETLLVDMLRRRDQWLRHLVGVRNKTEFEQRKILESALQTAICDSLNQTKIQIPRDDISELLNLVCFAANNVADDHPLSQCRDLNALPNTDVDALPLWASIVDLLLKKDGAWRKSLTEKNGFPAPSKTKNKAEKALFKTMKARHKALTVSWQENTKLHAQLIAVTALPAARYQEDQWQIVAALCELLVIAVGHLRLVFASHGQVDFGEIAQSALNALGDADNPTDLALALDYRISHLLVDEFQDTSSGQFQLLERLTAGWQANDGRTLFLVGDPMQSIYRFREAEVGLYLRTRDHGIGDITLEPLTLSVNFRSKQGVVDWVNQNFRHVLPAEQNIASGAVPYSPSDAFHGAEPGSAVSLHPSIGKDAQAEAEQVVALVQQAKQTHPQGSTAILVRGRNHLTHIIPALKEAGLRFQAIDIERLDQRPVVQDLLSLTRALLHPADRVAWLACLRAPWCGLSLVDLEKLVADDHHSSVWDLLNQSKRHERLSAPGQQRLARVQTVFSEALRMRRRRGLRAWLEATWLALGGPACVENETDLEDAEVFFKLINTLDENADLADISILNERLQKLFALADTEADGSLQLMTIHKSKGLEFDTVILPGLHRSSRRDDPPLLMWLERVNAAGQTELMLAPIKAAGRSHDATYPYLRELDKSKGSFELGRVFYVAATRAKRQLHLLGQLAFDEKKGEFKAPASGSLLALLWPQVETEFERCPLPKINSQHELQLAASAKNRPIRRLKPTWHLALPYQHNDAETAAVETIETSYTARHVGTVVHLCLQRIAEEGLAQWNEDRVNSASSFFREALKNLGVTADELDSATAKVGRALRLSLQDERGRWILTNHHEAQCEYALSGILNDVPLNLILDRTFVAEGVRWIIDYKSSRPDHHDIAHFVATEKAIYREQLERYGALMSKLDSRPIQLALYFPLVQAWCQWPYVENKP